jgi:hypothetical protein
LVLNLKVFFPVVLPVMAFSPGIISIYAIRRARMRWLSEINGDEQAQLALCGGGDGRMKP